MNRAIIITERAEVFFVALGYVLAEIIEGGELRAGPGESDVITKSDVPQFLQALSKKDCQCLDLTVVDADSRVNTERATE